MTIIKNSLVDQIASVNAAMKAANEAQALSTQLYTDTDKSIKNLIDRTLMEFSLECNVVMRFSFTARPAGQNVFDPHFTLFHLIDAPVSRPLLCNNYFINIAGKWIHTKKAPNYNPSVYLHDLDLQTPLKYVDLNHLAEACAVLTEKTGCRVEHAQYTVVNRNFSRIPNSHEALLNLHPGGRIAAHGTKGVDPWAIVQTRKAHYVVYYSTSGYGFGYDTVVQPDKSVSDFYLWLGDKAFRQMTIPANVLKRLDVRGP